MNLVGVKEIKERKMDLDNRNQVRSEHLWNKYLTEHGKENLGKFCFIFQSKKMEET